MYIYALAYHYYYCYCCFLFFFTSTMGIFLRKSLSTNDSFFSVPLGGAD